ncbi:MAG: hypothetical protein HY565_05470 [Candidatus Kerfeldbacteria bacterium]|nr:hypothetical protein [Candidatus Kerfeldbacteria bacterium]
MKKFYGLIVLGSLAQIFLVWVVIVDPNTVVELLALVCPFVVGWCWNRIEQYPIWRIPHTPHMWQGRYGLYWFFPMVAGVVVGLEQPHIGLPIAIGLLALTMFLWNAHVQTWELNQEG